MRDQFLQYIKMIPSSVIVWDMHLSRKMHIRIPLCVCLSHMASGTGLTPAFIMHRAPPQDVLAHDLGTPLDAQIFSGCTLSDHYIMAA